MFNFPCVRSPLQSSLVCSTISRASEKKVSFMGKDYELKFTKITVIIGTLLFLNRYDPFIVYVVVLQAGGGLVVAMVVKYADNILKGFATSLAIVVSCIASVIFFEFQVTTQFCFGTSVVIASIFLYGYQPTPKGKPSSMIAKV